MNIFEKILFRYKILKLNDQRIKHWIQKNQFEKIYFASKIGNFKVRLKILNGIGNLLENEVFLKIGIELIDDKIKIVSEKSIEILKNSMAKLKPDLADKIEEKQRYWTEKEKGIHKNIRKSKYTESWKGNKDAMVRLKTVKQQLKKSMYGEKWF